MTEPEFPLCGADDPRVPVVLDILRKSAFMGGNFTLDARRILAALDRAFNTNPEHGYAKQSDDQQLSRSGEDPPGGQT